MVLQSTTHQPVSLRAMKAIGLLGALLALAILGASIFLRLTSVIGPDEAVRSTLPVDTENTVRMVHRLAAASVGILAVVVSVLCWMQRKTTHEVVKPVLWLIGATVLLAVIGPLTPGYRFSSVTVTNVVTGTILFAACWWLREALVHPPGSQQSSPDPMVRMAFWVLAVHVGLGAAASALEMRGTHWVAFVHAGSAMLATLLLGSVLWDRRAKAPLRAVVVTMTVLLVAQVALGVVALWTEGRPVGLGFVHAMLSPLLAGGLVSIAVRDYAAAS